MKPSLYAQYVMEREGKHIYECESGFVTFLIKGQECYIADIFVSKSSRNKKEGTKMLNEVTKIAKSKECQIMIGQTVPSTRGSTESLKAAIQYGFVLNGCDSDRIYLIKEI